ncbi:uncharacterized protein LOC110847584 [Folsomia candida]|uniref:Lipocalin-15 n=1 Tax=Folsomia candida TaxID=158441 RepID=A0A226EJ80_FOLCA|nr:uncharacterized protein LOC110847584 [Folsomia candida]OXA57773.1 Lipocalin-15 [Folsomia candida]
MRFQKFSEFVILVQLLIYALVQGQQGETCASKIEKLWPRQQLDMERFTGQWMVIQLARMNDSLVEDSFAKCVSQTISRQPDSDNLNIRIELTLIADGTQIARFGQVNTTSDQPAIWKWSYFDNLAQFWEGVVIATDYEKYWIHYECEEVDGFRIESVVLRYRERTVGPGQLAIYASLMEGLGFPVGNLVDIPQPADCA